MNAVPVSLKDANAFVEKLHRHHKPVQGHKFSIGAQIDGRLVGVAICGRPVARLLDDGVTLEVTRLCTDGTRNACSFLYSRAAQAATAIGYRRVQTYILAEEPGTTLKAAGWKFVAATSGDTWSRPGRKRIDKAPTTPKQRWAREL